MMTRGQFATSILQSVAGSKGHDALSFADVLTNEDAKDGGIALCMKAVGLLEGDVDPQSDSTLFLCVEEEDGNGNMNVLQLTIGEMLSLLPETAN